MTVEAWAPTRDLCLAEAVAGMAATFVSVPRDAPLRELACTVEGDSDAERLLAMLEEAIYVMDVSGAVPVAASVRSVTNGTLRFVLITCDVADTVGAAPKAVTRHGLGMWEDGTGWHCTVTLDV